MTEKDYNILNKSGFANQTGCCCCCQTGTGAFLSDYGGCIIKGLAGVGTAIIGAKAQECIAKSKYALPPNAKTNPYKPTGSGNTTTNIPPPNPTKTTTGKKVLYWTLGIVGVGALAGVVYMVVKKKK